MEPLPFRNELIIGDCISVMNRIPADSIAGCITDPPYNYEFIGRDWDRREIERRTSRVQGNTSTLVKNIPYGSGLAGGSAMRTGIAAIARMLKHINDGARTGVRNYSEFRSQEHWY